MSAIQDDYLALLNSLIQVRPPYRGVVEDNDDPLGRNRVKVRIPSLYGVPGVDPEFIPTAALPWAEVPSASAGNDRGTSLVPHIGDVAIVELENDDPNQPVCTGFLYRVGIGNDIVDGFASNSLWTEKGGFNNETSSLKSSVPGHGAKGLTPIETLYKSGTGAEIGIYGQDGKQTMRFIDGLGQIMEFGFQSEPGTTEHRGTADRSRMQELLDHKGLADKKDIGDSGYILLQNANESGEDSKLMLANDLVEIENGVSNITLKKDHVDIYNGKMTIKLTDESAYIADGVGIIAITNGKSNKELDKNLGAAASSAIQSGIGSAVDNALGGESGEDEESITLTNSKCVFKMQGESMLISAPDTINMSAGKYINITAGTAITITCGTSSIIMALNSIIMEGTTVTIAGLTNLNLFAGKLMTLLSSLIMIN